jgi:hypothetical protein
MFILQIFLDKAIDEMQDYNASDLTSIYNDF